MSPFKITRLLWAVLLSLLAFSFPPAAQANPQGGTVVAGQASIGTPNATTVQVRQQSGKAIIDWRSFSIGAGETTQFIQPDAKSITLNRVTGGDPSQILGNLNANGQVWLINANGILFGKSARVDTAGLLATTIDIDNQNFLSGAYKFNGAGKPGAMVENRGAITIRDAGLAALVAPGVENSGVITASLGRIQLSSAAGFTVDFYGDGKINFALDRQVTQSLSRADGSAPTAGVSNSGSLIADGGLVMLTANAARSVIDQSINNSGLIEARSVRATNGEVILDGGAEGTVQVTGTVDASGTGRGQTGGEIQVLGDVVHLADGAHLDARGFAGGGRILIGGDFQGGTPDPAIQALVGFKSEGSQVRNASAVTIDGKATVDASAIDTGAGGQVAIWSLGATNIEGSISAQGGIHFGTGGIIETSGHALNVLNASVKVNGGVGGQPGAWLLDPHFIVTAAGDFAGVGAGKAAGDVDTGLVIRPGDLVAIYGVGSLLPDTDDAATAGSDPDEESEHRFPYSVVPSNGLFAQIGTVGPTPIPAGVNFGLGITTGHLILGINGEDGGPGGHYDVDVAVISRGELALNLALLAIPYVGEIKNTALAVRIAELLRLGEEASPLVDLLIDDKIAAQMAKRGWTEEEMLNLQRTKPTGTSVDLTNGGGSATVYGDKQGYMVVNDRTGRVVQISDKTDPGFIPDKNIKWK